MKNLVIWGGPVSTSNISGVDWLGVETDIITENVGANGGIGSSAFAAWAESLGPNPILEIGRQNGVDPLEYSAVALMGFSAWHGAMNIILTTDDAPLVTAIGAFDAYFTSNEMTVKEGYRSFIERAERSDGLAVVTTSANGGNDYPPGNASFRKLVEELSVQPGEGSLPPGVPEPRTFVEAGSFLWADYEHDFTHQEHATKLATLWTNAVIAPYLAGERPSSSSILVPVAVGIGALALGYAWYRSRG